MLLKRARVRGGRIGSLAGLDEASLQNLDINGDAVGELSGLNDERMRPFDGLPELLRSCEKAVRRMDPSALTRALGHAASHLSRDSLLTEVISPLMHFVGNGWSAKTLGVVHEHFASNVVREFLAGLLHQAAPGENAPSMVVTTPAGQRHEIGALAAAVAAAGRGWKVFYFGPDLPGADIAAAAASKNAAAVCLSVTRAPRSGALRCELRRLRQQVGDSVRIFIGGQGAAACEQPTDRKDFVIFSNISDFTACVGLPGSA